MSYLFAVWLTWVLLVAIGPPTIALLDWTMSNAEIIGSLLATFMIFVLLPIGTFCGFVYIVHQTLLLTRVF